MASSGGDVKDMARKLNACGLPLVGEGAGSYVDLPFAYVVTISIPAGDVTPVLLFDQEIVIKDETEFWLRRIRTTNWPLRLVRWRWGVPGTWQMSDRVSMLATLGRGSFGKGVNQYRFAPGSKILYEIESTNSSPLDFQLVFDGVERIYL